MKNDLELARAYIEKAQAARERNINFSLSFAKFKKLMSTKKCYYTGIAFDMTNNQGDNYRSIDRLDNSRGYTDNNTVVCTRRINRAKGDARIEEILSMAKKLGPYKKKQDARKAAEDKAKSRELKVIESKLGDKYIIKSA
jgi:hypothetical protein